MVKIWNPWKTWKFHSVTLFPLTDHTTVWNHENIKRIIIHKKHSSHGFHLWNDWKNCISGQTDTQTRMWKDLFQFGEISKTVFYGWHFIDDFHDSHVLISVIQFIPSWRVMSDINKNHFRQYWYTSTKCIAVEKKRELYTLERLRFSSNLNWHTPSKCITNIDDLTYSVWILLIQKNLQTFLSFSRHVNTVSMYSCWKFSVRERTFKLY